MGVNDLVGEYRARCESIGSQGHCKPYIDRGRRCPECPMDEADSISAIAEEAWHPVSEPPTQDDGDECGHVIVRDGSEMHYCNANWVRRHGLEKAPDAQWARIRDVVLLPPESN